MVKFYEFATNRQGKVMDLIKFIGTKGCKQLLRNFSIMIAKTVISKIKKKTEYTLELQEVISLLYQSHTIFSLEIFLGWGNSAYA